MGNMKFDGADVTFELDGYDALVERVRSKKVNCKINPSDLPRLYAVMDAELEGNEELAAAFAEVFGRRQLRRALAWRGRDQQEGCAGAFDGWPVWARLGRGLRRAHVR